MEKAASIANAPHAPIPPLTPAEVEADVTLDYESMVLMSQLEQRTIRLTDSVMQASQALALEYLVQVANDLMAFTEKLPLAQRRKVTLTTVLTRDRANYALLGLDYVHDGRLALAAFEQQHIRRGTFRQPNTFELLSRDLLRMMNIAFNICVKSFHTPTLQQQWRTVYGGFLVHLVRSLQKLHAPSPDAAETNPYGRP